MMAETQAYSPGDWIVHRNYGVGQIKGNEVMDIGGRKNSYCKIETRDSTFWIPLEKLNDDWLRPLASPAVIEEALVALKNPPRTMEANPNERKNRIGKVKPNNSPVTIAKIVRDLSAHNKEKKQVSQSDLNALRYFADLLLAEWSVSLNLELKDVKQQLDNILAQAQAQA